MTTDTSYARVDAFTTLPASLHRPLYMLYEAAFKPLNALCAQRHLMTSPEFSIVMGDHKVVKLVDYGADGVTVDGAAVITNHLDAWPLIAPEFFARVYPQQYARAAVWYVGWVFAAPGKSRTGIFRRLVQGMYDLTMSNDGVAVMDFSRYKIDDQEVLQQTFATLYGIDPTTNQTCLDTQSWWAYSFAPKDQPR
jgi:hypothetical protein